MTIDPTFPSSLTKLVTLIQHMSLINILEQSSTNRVSPNVCVPVEVKTDSIPKIPRKIVPLQYSLPYRDGVGCIFIRISRIKFTEMLMV